MPAQRMLGGAARLARRTVIAVAVVLLLAWGLWLRPEPLGGRTGYVVVSGASMEPALHGGDLVLVRSQPAYEVGDVVAYRIPQGAFKGKRVIHRIVGGDAQAGFVVRGDNKPDNDLWRPRVADIEGKQWKLVPAAGRLITFARSPSVLAAVAGGFAFAMTMTWKPKENESAEADSCGA